MLYPVRKLLTMRTTSVIGQHQNKVTWIEIQTKSQNNQTLKKCHISQNDTNLKATPTKIFSKLLTPNGDEYSNTTALYIKCVNV